MNYRLVPLIRTSFKGRNAPRVYCENWVICDENEVPITAEKGRYVGKYTDYKPSTSEKEMLASLEEALPEYKITARPLQSTWLCWFRASKESVIEPMKEQTTELRRAA
jgi:hypothetical protein